jgi:peptidoglycan/LPS O-acetylase OafA/YrhL
MGGHRKVGGLEVIRAIAALIVVLNHLVFFRLVGEIPVLSLIGQYATEAVIVFFVLSGTVITLSYGRLDPSTSRRQAVRDYCSARLIRIYPIYLVGIAIGFLAAEFDRARFPSLADLFGNLVFLQSLQGYLVHPLSLDPPLWSLSYEMTYYALFALALASNRAPVLWTAVAIGSALLYPPTTNGGIVSHVIAMMAFSIPWLLGHWISSYRAQLPKVPVSFGVSCLAIGAIYARCPLTRDYFDLFRLLAFSICASPLILAIIQNAEVGQYEKFGWQRIALLLPGLALLWSVSHSLLMTKIVLSIVGAVFAFIPLCFIARVLRFFGFALRPLVYVGSISYAVYVVHVPIIYISAHFIAESRPFLRLVTFTLVTLGISHILEWRFQPILRRQFSNLGFAKRAEAKP